MAEMIPPRCRRLSQRFGRCDLPPAHEGHHAVYIGDETWFGWQQRKVIGYLTAPRPEWAGPRPAITELVPVLESLNALRSSLRVDHFPDQGIGVPAIIRILKRTVEDGDCWVWTGVPSGGYGKVFVGYVDGRPRKEWTHRLSYEAFTGRPIPAGMHIDHLCRRTTCLRPSHLEVVTSAENTRRGAAVRTTCPAGHNYDSLDRGHRRCLTCHRERERDRARRRQAA